MVSSLGLLPAFLLHEIVLLLEGDHKAHLESIRMETKYDIFKTYYLKDGLGDWEEMKEPILKRCVNVDNNATPEQKAKYEVIRIIDSTLIINRYFGLCFSCMKLLKNIQMAYMDAGETLNPNTRIYDFFNIQVGAVYNIIAYTELIITDEK